MKGGRKEVNGHVEAPTNVRNTRDVEAKQWEMPAEPVRLNAKKSGHECF